MQFKNYIKKAGTYIKSWKNGILTIFIFLFVLTGPVLVGLAIDLSKNYTTFWLIGLGLGLLIDAIYLETIRKEN